MRGNSSDIKIIFLGTSAGVPTKNRNVPSILVLRCGEYIFFDFGEGTQRQLFKMELGFRKRLKIFITHMHGDHILGLPGLIQTLSLFKREDPLEVYGPPQLEQFINITVEMMGVDPVFPINFHPVYDGAVFDFREYYIKAIRNIHWGLSFSYMLKEYDRPGIFNAELASSLDIPKVLWGRLSKGKDVVFNGRHYKSKDFFIPPPIRGRKIVYSGDTMPFEGMVEFARDADVLIHEATYSSNYYSRSLETKHCTAKDAAEIAKKANTKILILTHFSARYSDVDELLNEARRVFPSTFVAEDSDVVEIPYVKPKRM